MKLEENRDSDEVFNFEKWLKNIVWGGGRKRC